MLSFFEIISKSASSVLSKSKTKSAETFEDVVFQLCWKPLKTKNKMLILICFYIMRFIGWNFEGYQ